MVLKIINKKKSIDSTSEIKFYTNSITFTHNSDTHGMNVSFNRKILHNTYVLIKYKNVPSRLWLLVVNEDHAKCLLNKISRSSQISSRLNQKFNREACLHNLTYPIFMMHDLLGDHALSTKTGRAWNVLGQLETSQYHNQNLRICGCRKRRRTWQIGEMML